MNNNLKSILDLSKSLLIVLPKRPLFDQVAAGLSLFLSLREEKEVEIYCPDPMLVEFNSLIGVDKVKNDFGNKNLALLFENYKAVNAEKIAWDENKEDLLLYVVPKAGFEAPRKEQLKVFYTGLSSDTLFLIGGANENHFPILSSNEVKDKRIFHIGNRDLSLSSSFSNVLSLVRPGSSVCEVVASLIKESEFKINEDIATNLLQGIEYATNSFSSLSMTAESFEMVSYLLRQGGRRKGKEREYRQPTPPNAKYFFQREDKKPQVDLKEEDTPPQEWLEPKIYKGNIA